jgi:hypothetical protein
VLTEAVIPFLSVTFHFAAPEGPANLPFPGAAWRGAFGYALKRTVCLMRPRVCPGCPFERSCAYPYVFETAPADQSTLMRQADRTPRPFVMRLGGRPQGDESSHGVEIGMTLMGRAIDHLPYIIHAMSEAGERGIGRQRLIHTLERVTDRADQEIWRPGSNLAPPGAEAPVGRLRPADRLSVQLVSPLRLVRNGMPVRPEDLDGPTIAMAAVRRVALLRDGFAPTLPAIDFQRMRALAAGVRLVERDLAWFDQRRFSTRQSQLITMGGMTGRLTLDIEGAPEILPFLETCEHVHLGKGVTLGLGEVALAAA